MWRPERAVVGPRAATADDVKALNRVFADTFTERYRRDGMVGVRVPELNPRIWAYAVRDAGQGAMVWHDEHDALVAFNIAHCSGAEGWMGPLAVRTDRQGVGIGRTIVTTAVEWMQRQGVGTLGLETMPRTVENIGFYSQLGFRPGQLTVTVVGDASRRRVAGRWLRASELSERERHDLWDRCRDRLQGSAPGYGYRREMQLTDELELGDTTVIEDQGLVRGFALWHDAPLTADRPTGELRVLKVFADDVGTFERLVVAIEACAAAVRLRHVAIRCQTAYADAYAALIRRGYRVRWTDLRMSLADYPEPSLPGGELLFSNWEI